MTPDTTAAGSPFAPVPGLPPGYCARALVTSDAQAVVDVFVAMEARALSEPTTELADVQSDWARPSVDLATQSLGIEHEGRLVAAAQVHGVRAVAAVHPDHEGLGLGTAILGWVIAGARAQGADRVGQPVPVASAGERFLTAKGATVLWDSWLLELPQGTEVEERPLPAGYDIRAARAEELPAVHQVVEDAFGEWENREPMSYEDWRALIVERPGATPDLLRVVVDGSGRVVGMAAVMITGDLAYVQELAVSRDQRGQGLAQALLADAFAVGRRLGARRAQLSTDSRTGALGLYEKVGMEVLDSWRHLSIAL